MFLFDNWYVAALTDEVPAGAPVARTICAKPVVLFRTADGAVSVLEDRCMHRGMPLSLGTVCDNGNALRCPYHGLKFDGSGACVKVPGQATTPGAMRVISYPVIERYSMIWVWPGDPARANPADIPDLRQLDDPAWEAFNATRLDFQADWQLVHDNLMDMTHVAYVHDLINGDTEAHSTAKMTVISDEEKNRVSVKRKLPDCDPPVAYQTTSYTFKGRIDRWQEFEMGSSGVEFWSGGTDAGTGAFEGKRDGGFQLRHFHGITPSTEGNCYYFFRGVRNFSLGDKVVGSKLKYDNDTTLLQDKVVIEAQQRRLDETGDRPLVSIAADAGGLQARRLLKRLLDAEAQRRPEPVPQRAANVEWMLQHGSAPRLAN